MRISKRKFKGYRLLIHFRDNSRPIIQDEFGNKSIPSIEKEVTEISLGSLTNPNKEIIHIKFEPIELANEEDI